MTRTINVYSTLCPQKAFSCIKMHFQRALYTLASFRWWLKWNSTVGIMCWASYQISWFPYIICQSNVWDVQCYAYCMFLESIYMRDSCAFAVSHISVSEFMNTTALQYFDETGDKEIWWTFAFRSVCLGIIFFFILE